jgi:hypothetical protein
MNRTWQVHRETVAHIDGQRRWDRAYQLLLRWAADRGAAPVPTLTQEETDAHCPVGPCLDQPPATDPHD